ncbi:MAG: alkaline shock response membrane anchor protein AmaP [Dehalococcoidia bacterium]|nr:alkaline shock response membrane anchor protein AmaP [Dehalococcoidia bacterium]
MNIFNRALAILFSVVLVVGGLMAFFLTLAAPNEANAYVQSWAVYLSEQVTFTNRLAVGLVAAVAVVAGVLIFVLELPKRSSTSVQLKKVNGGSGVLTVGAIAQRVQHDTELLEGVRRAKPLVHGKGKRVDIRIDLTTDPYVEAAAKTQEVCQAVRDNVEGQMGVRVGRINVRINHDPIRNGTPSRPASDVP